jgi:hypothetical protein
MLLPALNKARDRAKSISCTSNLKQIGLALNQYINDYDGRTDSLLPQDSGKIFWDGLLNKYINNKKVFRCLADSRTEVKWFPKAIPCSYAVLNFRPQVRKINQVKRPSTLIFASDYHAEFNGFNTLGGNYYNSTAYPKYPEYFAPHNLSSNNLIYDGHAVSYKFMQIPAEAWTNY